MKNGFTLIELLAVIVILAIIALIAVPIVLNIINDSKESSLLRSAEFYLDAVEYTIADAFLYHGGLDNGTYPITSTGDICKKALPCDDANTLKVEVNGDKPTGGTITINGGNISDVKLVLDEKTIVKDTDGTLIYQIKPCEKITGDKDTPGSMYECEVSPGVKYNFYVLSGEDDGTTNLIMERNICEDGTLATKDNICAVAWINQDDYESLGGQYWEDWGDNNHFGPITAMNYLNQATSSWRNIPNLNITYDDEARHFTNFVLNGKARLPYRSEVNDVGCYYQEDLSCPVWMIDYLHDVGDIFDTTYQQNTIENIYGYWTLSSFVEFSNGALQVYYYGGVYDNGVNDILSCGVRPVINVKL